MILREHYRIGQTSDLVSLHSLSNFQLDGPRVNMRSPNQAKLWPLL